MISVEQGFEVTESGHWKVNSNGKPVGDTAPWPLQQSLFQINASSTETTGIVSLSVSIFFLLNIKISAIFKWREINPSFQKPT